MVIEFIGTPGAGKTTLLPAVAEYLQRQGICARTIVDAARPYAARNWLGKLVMRLAPQRWQGPLLWQIFYHISTGYRLVFTLAHPQLVFQVFGSQWARPIPLEARHHAWHWFFHLIGYYQFMQTYARPNEALVLDEGFVHRVVQMNASEWEVPDQARIAAYLARVPRPDLVIAVQAPWELCVERIYQRGIWERFRTKAAADVACYIQNAHCIVEMTVEQMQAEGWPLIQIDNSGHDAAQARQELCDKLTKLAVGQARIRVDSPLRGVMREEVVCDG